ncbi:MAG: hypothetical protein Tsb0027_02340 [Wenzhouxiangellaceae bacterium]
MNGRAELEARLNEELRERINSRHLPDFFFEVAGLEGEALDASVLRIIDPSRSDDLGRELRGEDFRVERIIREFKRPTLLVRNGSFESVVSEVWSKTLESHRASIEGALPAVGRIEVKNHNKYAWVGTGFLVATDILATNRHVAEEFARRDGSGFAWKLNNRGRRIQPRIDFREEYQLPDEEEFKLLEVLYLAAEEEPDLALLRVDATDLKAQPLDLQADRDNVEFVGAVGYPWRDSRVEPHLLGAMERYFQGIFDVKRFAPGTLISVDNGDVGHDCTTLGGSSGSAVLDLTTGGVLGLHYGGYDNVNVAVPATVVQDRLAAL